MKADAPDFIRPKSLKVLSKYQAQESTRWQEQGGKATYMMILRVPVEPTRGNLCSQQNGVDVVRFSSRPVSREGEECAT